MHKIVFISVLVVLQTCHGKISLGKCPDLDPVPQFNVKRFLGRWYAIQETSTTTPCLSYYITEDVKNDHYKITTVQQHSTIWPQAFHHEHNITGELTIPNPAQPARMDLSVPIEIGDSTFTVFLTDYDTYAAVFICKNLALAHSWSAKILSRTKKLDMNYVDEIRTRLASYNVDPSNLEMVSHNLCPKQGTRGSVVRTASNVVTNAGKKIYGIVSNVGNTLYELTLDPKEESEEKCSNILCEMEKKNRDVKNNRIDNTQEEDEVYIQNVGIRYR